MKNDSNFVAQMNYKDFCEVLLNLGLNIDSIDELYTYDCPNWSAFVTIAKQSVRLNGNDFEIYTNGLSDEDAVELNIKFGEEMGRKHKNNPLYKAKWGEAWSSQRENAKKYVLFSDKVLKSVENSFENNFLFAGINI